MRDFRDAKVMARALRDALKAMAIETSHSEALELIAKAFGYDHWNILSAKIEAADEPTPSHRRTVSSPATSQNDLAPPTLYCSFCGKSQHEVRKLFAGPSVFICDGCIELCTDIVDKELFRLTTGNEGGGEGPCSNRRAGCLPKSWHIIWNAAGKSWRAVLAPCDIFSKGWRSGTARGRWGTMSHAVAAS